MKDVLGHQLVVVHRRTVVVVQEIIVVYLVSALFAKCKEFVHQFVLVGSNSLSGSSANHQKGHKAREKLSLHIVIR